MTDTEYDDQIVRLQNLFGRAMTKEQVKAWWEFIQPHEAEAMRKAVDELAQTKKMFPSLAEILDTTKSFERVESRPVPDHKAPVRPEVARGFLKLLKREVA